jgi:ABC-type multidrug transport system fused ATPase/permease subunit
VHLRRADTARAQRQPDPACTGRLQKAQHAAAAKLWQQQLNAVRAVQEVTQMIHAIWGAPCLIVVVTWLLYKQIQWATFVGLAVNLLLVPITTLVAKRLSTLRREIIGWTDKRTSTMDEVINGMRVIKFYAWEVPFRYAPMSRGATAAVSCGLLAMLCTVLRNQSCYRS